MGSLQRQIIWLGRFQWILATTLALLGAAFYFGAYRRQTAQLASLEGRIVGVHRELADCQSQTKMLASVAADVARLKSRLKDFKSLPAQMDLHVFMKDLAQLQQMASLRNFNQSNAGDTTHGDRLDQKPITFTFEGDFVNVFSFLRHAEELPRLTRVPKMSIKRRDSSGLVKVQMTMDIYSMAE
jgi:Tfp pilus assembly protein PilO